MRKKLSRRDALKTGSSLAAVVAAGALSGCSGSSDSTDTPDVETPQALGKASFTLEYNSSGGELEIMLASNHVISPENLYVRGEGLDSTGSWAELGGSASGEMDGSPGVKVFDTVTVSAESGYQVELVWEKEGKTVTLQESSGDS